MLPESPCLLAAGMLPISERLLTVFPEVVDLALVLESLEVWVDAEAFTGALISVFFAQEPKIEVMVAFPATPSA